MAARLIGLDMGTTTIKIVELEQAGRKGKLLGAQVVATPPKGILSEASFDMLSIAQAIRKACQEAKINTKAVNISLPEHVVFARVVEMPNLSDKELTSAIHWEAEQYIPFPLSDAVLDYQVVSEGKAGSGGKMLVFLAAAQRSLVEKYEKIIEMAGLNLVSVETETLALNRALISEDGSSSASLVIAIGAEHTSLFVSKGGNIIVTYSLRTGSSALTRALASDLGMDQKQAEEYKKTYGLEKDVLSGKIGSTVQPLLNSLLSEVKRVMSFYQEKTEGAELISRVVLSGGGAKLPGLVVYFTENLGVEVQIGDPWQKVTTTQKASSPSFDPIILSQAIGLALKQLPS